MPNEYMSACWKSTYFAVLSSGAPKYTDVLKWLADDVKPPDWDLTAFPNEDNW